MEQVPVNKLSHKEWRKIAKKERRRRFRTRDARARYNDAQRLNEKLKNEPGYLKWLENQRISEELKAAREIEEHELLERKWLEEEVRAQKEWRIHQERKAKARQEQLDQEARIRKEFEAKQEALRLKKEEAIRKEEEESKRFADLQREIDVYIDEGGKTPEVLRSARHTQPGKEPCPFFSKTGACRYGDTCSRNHHRLALSKVILVPGFYSHFSLEKNSAEYDTDIGLEFDSSETRKHFREFYNDVLPELENFGRIKTLKYCCNAEIHLRGNMYVEYYTEREAARALRSLKGRWYAGRQLNCEFTNIKSWRNAVCGMPKCPKGRGCNFLHTFRNPRDEYDIKSPPRSRMRQDDRRFQSATNNSSRSSRVEQESSRSGGWRHESFHEESSRNWRWSDSGDSETESTTHRTNESARNKRRRDPTRRSRKKLSGGDEGSDIEAEIQRDKKRREENRGSTSRSRKAKKKKNKERDAESQGQPERTKDRGNRRNGKGRTSVTEKKEKSKDRSKRRDSSRKSHDKSGKTRWDDPNGTTDSEGDLDPGNSERTLRASRKPSRSPSWSEAEATYTSGTQRPKSERQKVPNST